MLLINKLLFLFYFFELNFFYFLFLLFFSFLLFFFGKNFIFLNYFRNINFLVILKYIFLFSLLFSFLLFILSFILYYFFIYNFNLYLINVGNFLPFFFFNYSFNIYFLYKNFYLNLIFYFDLFGMFILFLAFFVGFLSFLVLDTRLYWKNIKYYYTFCIFLSIVFLFSVMNNIIFFFLLYECLLVPSFFFVYFISPSRRAIQASLYFLIWTQLGSFFVLLVMLYIINVSGCYDFFSLKFFKFNCWELYCIYIFLFFGFCIKVPIWPFHYWLTKTHVEAPSGFSIFLSGFLVKSALYGFFKFTFSLNLYINTTIFVIFCFFGVFDSSLKMWGQNDLKKLVAYCTVQEMNFIFVAFCFGETNFILCGFIFCLTHAFLSSLMFFLVDCVYKRFHSRNITNVSGISVFSPNLSFCIVIMCILYAGLPGTVKFIVEFILFSGLLEYSVFFCFIFIFSANVLGLIGFTKSWLNSIFGIKRSTLVFKLDLVVKEVYIIFSSFFFLIFFSYMYIYL